MNTVTLYQCLHHVISKTQSRRGAAIQLLPSTMTQLCPLLFCFVLFFFNSRTVVYHPVRNSVWKSAHSFQNNEHEAAVLTWVHRYLYHKSTVHFQLWPVPHDFNLWHFSLRPNLHCRLLWKLHFITYYKILRVYYYTVTLTNQ